MFPARGTRPKSAMPVRPMTTSVQFANEEQFNRFGYNVLYQAHAASMQLAVLTTQLAANQNTMMPMINPMFSPQSNATAPAITAGSASGALLSQSSFNAPAITAGLSPGALRPQGSLTAPAINAGLPPGALCVRSSATVSAFATGLSPGAPEIQWPFLEDPSLRLAPQWGSVLAFTECGC